MRVGMPMSYSGGFAETADVIVQYEDVGLDVVFVAEAYSFDAVSQLGYLAARTSRLQSVRFASSNTRRLRLFSCT